MASESESNRALQIFSMTDGSYKIDTEAFHLVLDKVGDLPFIIVSINGACREGKSYVLNYFMRYLRSQQKGNGEVAGAHTPAADWFDSPLSKEEMFSWRSGRERETLGINLWSEPFIIKQQDGRQVAILLLDCQGLFDDKTTFQENAVIFSLSNLLSSVMIYNVKSKIDENLLHHIQFFSDYARAIAVQENCGSGGDHQGDLDQLPHLTFLVRDFDFVNEYEFGLHEENQFPKTGTEDVENPENYWSAIFSILNGMPRENQCVRHEIVKKYRNTSIFLLPHPGNKFVRNSLEVAPKPKFRHHLKSFVTHVCGGLSHSGAAAGSLASPKMVGGIEVSGRDFKSFVTLWAKVCQESATTFPEAKTIAESTTILQNETAASTALASFNQRFHQFCASPEAGCEDSVLVTKYEQFLDESIQMYGRLRRLGGPEVEQQYVDKIRKKCGQFFEDTHFKINGEIRHRKMAEVEREREKIENDQRIEEMKQNIEQSRKNNEDTLQRLRREHENKESNHEKEIDDLLKKMDLLKSQNKDTAGLEKKLEEMLQAQVIRDDEYKKQMQMISESIVALANRPIQVVSEPPSCVIV